MNKKKSCYYTPQENQKVFVQEIFSSTAKKKPPTIIFLHDSWGCVEMWGDFPEKIVEIIGHNALLYDRIGHGKSSPLEIEKRPLNYHQQEAEALIKLLDFMQIEKAILYGHSDGATIATIAGALFPNRIEALLLEATHSFIEDSGVDAVKATYERSKKTNLKKKLSLFHKEKTALLFQLWHETWTSETFKNWSIEALLKQIKCPILAFQSDSDPFGSKKQLTILQEATTGSVKIAEIKNTIHCPHKEAEKESLDLIVSFLENKT